MKDDKNSDDSGRFVRGNRAGEGNPMGMRVQALRVALLESVSAKDIREIIHGLVAQAKGGDLAAAKLLLEKTLGTIPPWDILEKLAELEAQNAVD